MLNVRFIRHGESLANVGGVTAEPHAVPLTDKGWQQAQKISQTFDSVPGLIITSPYLRALYTASPTLTRFPNIPFEIWPIQEIEMLATARRVNTSSEERRPLIEDYWARRDPDFIDGEGAESYRAFAGRVRHALRKLTGCKECYTIVVFAHEQFMKGILLEIADPGHEIDAQAMRAFHRFHHENRIENADGFSICWDGRQWKKGLNIVGFDANTGTE